MAALVPAANAGAGPAYIPEELVVKYVKGTEADTKEVVASSIGAKLKAGTRFAQTETLVLPKDLSVKRASELLITDARVAYSGPNYLAQVADFLPNDPGNGAGWQALQWNFLSGAGVNTPAAWSNMIAAGRPGGKGVTVAIIDTGVAYRDMGRFKRAPDLPPPGQIVKGYDFVDSDPYPIDEHGHGTHVAGTIAEQVNNGMALTGIAYGTKIMPVRALDSFGEGDIDRVAAAVRFAARKGAKVLNVSVQFNPSLKERQLPQMKAAIKYAYRKGATIVAATGNMGLSKPVLPARFKRVLAVGATTEHLCLAEYSNERPDLVAPGGGDDRSIASDPHCDPTSEGQGIYQQSFQGNPSFFFLRDQVGTSMAAPHVSATAALVIASRVIGKRPSPAKVEQRLKATARDLGTAGSDHIYGAGLIDAGAATAP